MSRIESLLSGLYQKGVRLAFEDDQLWYEAATGALAAEDIDRIRAHKTELIALLRNEQRSERPLLHFAANRDEQTLPLSFAQERLWFVEQLGLAGWSYNIPVAHRLEGPLQIAALEHAFAELLRRHEILRTRIVSMQGQAQQVIAAAGEFHLPVVDLSALEESDRRKEAERLLQQDVQQVFELESGPLLRASLLRLAEQEHLLQMTLHHIVFDGWSAAMMMKELSELYAAQVQGRPALLEPLRVQYADYALWQRQWLSGEALQEQLRYWKERLQGVPSVLELPTDYRRPAVASFKGRVMPFELSGRLHAGLNELAGKEGATLYMVLLAAFQVLLWRWSGERDVVVGSPIAGRTERELEPLIGLFVNTLLMRTQLREGTSFRALLREVRQTALGAYAHQEMPFERLVAELQPQRDLSRQPLCQVALNLESVLLSEIGLTQKLKWFPLETAPTVSKVDLELVLQESAAGLRGYFVYAADLFAPETVERIAGYFKKLLEAAVADPDRRIEELPLMSEAQRDEVLRGWNATQAEVEQCCIHEAISRQAQRTPDAIAVSCAEKHLNYQELDRRANQLAHYLRGLGVGAEVVVGLCVERSLDMMVGLLGILKAGAAYLPLDPSYPAQRLKYMVSDARVSVLVTQSEISHGLDASGLRVVKLDEDWAQIEKESAQAPATEVNAQNLAYVIYTSGSTGQPKGVMATHGGVMNLLAGLSAGIEMTEQDVVLGMAPFSFDMSVADLYWPLCCGGRLILCSSSVARDGVQLKEHLSRTGATVLHATPTTWRMLLEGGWRPAELKMICGGEALTEDLARALTQGGGKLWNLYGPTETTVIASSCEYRDGERIAIGRPIANVRMYVLDERMEPVGIGVAGELYIAGAGLARGYLRKAALTAERFIPNPYGDGERLYRTGDRARYLQDGNLQYLGRVDRQVKLRGYRIELGEIEAAIRQYPNVDQAAVVARERAVGDQRLVAYVVSRNDQAIDGRTLQSHLEERVPSYMVPSVVVALDALPLGSSGKLDHSALPAPAEWGHGASVFAPPRTPTEDAAAAIWTKALGVARIGSHDDFFALGGHSLLATRVVADVQRVFDVEIPVRVLFISRSLSRFASQIDAARAEKRDATRPRLKAQPRPSILPLSFAQERLWFVEQLGLAGWSYNIPVAHRLEGPLQIAALEHAFAELLRRHEILRTRIVSMQGQAQQVIAAAGEFHLPVVDLSALEESDRRKEAERLLQQDVQQVFELESGPLLRASLLRLAEQEHLLQMTLHHIVFDGWSAAMMMKELSELYAAQVQGRPALLEPLRVQYADYALWQRQWLSGEALQEQLRYWKERLQGVPSVLELPTDYRRPAVASFKGRVMPFELSGRLHAGLNELAGKEGATLYMVLLAAFQVLLWRWSGERDVVVGSPIAGRTERELEPLIGLFVNTLLMRTQLREGTSFRALLREVRQTALGAYAHQEMPFERLVAELQPQRDLSRQPLCQVAFAMQNAPVGDLEMPGLKLRHCAGTQVTSKLDLTLYAMQSDSTVHAYFEYATDLFEQETVERIAGYFKKLLEAVVEDSDRRIDELPLMSEAQRDEVLHGWNATHAEVEQCCIHEAISRQAQRTPDAIAVSCAETHLNYQELDRRANQLAHYLRGLGVGPEVVVGLCVERSLEMMVGLLGILKAGAAYLPLDPSYPAQRLKYMVSDARVSVLVTQSEISHGLDASGLRVVKLDEDWAQIEKESTQAPATEVNAQNLAYVIYTSGSTGQPKGVMVTHAGLCNLAQAQGRGFAITAESRVLQFASLSFDASVSEILVTLRAGARLHMVRSSNPVMELVQVLREESISAVTLPPSVLPLLEGHEFAALRTLVVAGEACPLERAVWGAQRFKFINAYGPTETTVCASMYEYRGGERIAIGRPIANVRMYVLDERMEPVGIGVTGELYIAGVGLARGYLAKAALTAERFIPNPYGDGERLYRTGDRARYLQDGNLQFLGRADQQVKLRGYRIELGEIEAAIRQYPAVRHAVTLIQEELPGERALIACIEAEPEQVQIIELWQHLRQLLPDHMVPSAYAVVDQLPRLPNGKIDNAALSALQMQICRTTTYQAPRTPIEQALADIWAEVLRVQHIGVHDNFFDLGGHSLLAIRIAARIREILAMDLPLPMLFRAPTIAELAEFIVQNTLSAA